MVKHRFRESLRSFFGSHIDPEKEQLDGAKTDIEHKLQKILKLIEEENSKEDCNPVQNSKEPLAELIHEFYQQYRSLYSRYDHLTSVLRKKIYGKRQKESSSSSSDSESASEYSSKGKARKNGQQSEFQKIDDGNEQEFERARLEVADLNSKLAVATEEKAAMNQHIESFSEEQKQKEAMCRKNENLVMELRTTVEQLKDEKLNIANELEAARVEISITKQKLESVEQQVTILNYNLKATEEEKDSLKLKHAEISIEVQQAQNRIQELTYVSNQQTEKLGERQNEVAAIAEMHEVYKNASSAQLKVLAQQVTSLELEIRSLQIEKGNMETLIEMKTSETEDLEEYIQGLKDQIAEHEMVSKQREHERSALMKKLEDNENESLSRITDLTEQMSNLLTDIDSLRLQKGEMEEQLMRKNNEASTQIESVMNQIHVLQNEVESLLQQKTQLEVQLELRNTETSEFFIQIQKIKEEIASKTLDHQRVFEEKQHLTLHVGDMQQELASICDHKSEIEEQVKAMTLEINKLQEENSRLQDKIEHVEKMLSKRQAELVYLQDQHAGSVQLCERLKMELDSMNKEKSVVEEHIEAKAQENRQLTEEKLMLQQKMAEMENIIAEREVQFITLQHELNKKEDATPSQVMALTEQASNLQEELMNLQKQNEELVFQCQRDAEKLTTTENEKDDWVSRSSNYETKLTDREEAFQNLMEGYKQMERQFQECKMNLIVAETRIAELEREYHKTFELKHHTVTDLEQKVEDLKIDLEEKGDEINTTTEKVRTIEVKLRLSNQKLRVTEQLLSETEESFKNRELIFLEEKKEFEDIIASLSQRIIADTEAYQKMMTDISETIYKMSTGLENVMQEFTDDYTYCKNRILEISNELRIAKNWIEKMNREKDQLKHEAYCLKEHLRGKIEQELLLKERAEMLEKKSITEEFEKENLTHSINQLQKKVGELETAMKKQDGVMLDLGEEKREAIRQLCVWVDYHRYRYEYLKEVLSNRTSRGTRAA